VIVIEKLGPIDAVKRSASLLKQTWGESLSSTFSIRLFTFLASLLGIIPMVIGGALLANGTVALGIPLFLIGILILLGVSVISSALNSIVLAALYIYAVEGKAPTNFDANLVENAFAAK